MSILTPYTEQRLLLNELWTGLLCQKRENLSRRWCVMMMPYQPLTCVSCHPDNNSQEDSHQFTPWFTSHMTASWPRRSSCDMCEQLQSLLTPHPSTEPMKPLGRLTCILPLWNAESHFAIHLVELNSQCISIKLNLIYLFIIWIQPWQLSFVFCLFIYFLKSWHFSHYIIIYYYISERRVMLRVVMHNVYTVITDTNTNQYGWCTCICKKYMVNKNKLVFSLLFSSSLPLYSFNFLGLWMKSIVTTVYFIRVHLQTFWLSDFWMHSLKRTLDYIYNTLKKLRQWHQIWPP